MSVTDAFLSLRKILPFRLKIDGTEYIDARFDQQLITSRLYPGRCGYRSAQVPTAVSSLQSIKSANCADLETSALHNNRFLVLGWCLRIQTWRRTVNSGHPSRSPNTFQCSSCSSICDYASSKWSASRIDLLLRLRRPYRKQHAADRDPGGDGAAYFRGMVRPFPRPRLRGPAASRQPPRADPEGVGDEQ